jgi:RimJ/RimL family protein N-acetyltransferase
MTLGIACPTFANVSADVDPGHVQARQGPGCCRLQNRMAVVERTAPIDIDRPPATVIAGEVVLARWRPSDLESLFATISANIEHLRPWMAFAAHHGRNSVAQFLAASEAGWDSGERFEYAIRNRDGVTQGSTGLMARVGPGGLEIGYWLDARHTGKGIATLAVAALAEAGLELSAVDHVEIRHDEANTASAAIPARLGFRNIGTFAVLEPKAPAEVGRDVRWRLDATQFDASPARSLLNGARAAAAYSETPAARSPSARSRYTR